MVAAYVDALGSASAIRVGPLPVPVPGPTDVLVEVGDVAVNPVDTYVRSGRYRTPVPFPFVVGRDLVGTVAAVGSDVVPFRPGARVWCNSLGHAGRQGSFAEYAVVPVDRLYPLPDGVDARTAVAVAHPAATAYLGLFVHARLRPAETVFVGGGAGNVGTAAIQMAAAAGARVVASARLPDHPHCRRAGASVVVDHQDPDLCRRLVEQVPGGVDVVWETSGLHDFGVVCEVAAVGARVLVTAAHDAEVTLPLAQLYVRDVSLLGFVISRAETGDLAAAAGLINQMLVAQQLTARIADRLPLADTPRAHQRMEAGEVSGRLLLGP